ncbi:MAG: Spy/CpxP family protein refolding chaperone [Lachnoclostridium sp.]|nr:Spy/CpxP family protein refolding chaperone [Lachnoclostridium sp.]
MKKTILSLAILVASSTAIFAQKPAKCKADSTCTPTCELFFEGITLTPEQQTKVKSLNEARAAAAKAKKDEAKAEKADAKADRMEAKAAAKDARKSERKDYLNSMKSVLTPDQYVLFLENVYVNAPAGNGRPDMNKEGRRGDFKKDFKKGEAKVKRDFKKGEDKVKKELKK